MTQSNPQHLGYPSIFMAKSSTKDSCDIQACLN